MAHATRMITSQTILLFIRCPDTPVTLTCAAPVCRIFCLHGQPRRYADQSALELSPIHHMPKGLPKPWFAYILRCSNGCLYTGITTDVQRRLKVHNAGKGSAYVRAHRPAKLVAFTAWDSSSAASRLEYSVKSLSRAKKITLARKLKSRIAG